MNPSVDVNELVMPPPERKKGPWLHLGLFFATVTTTFGTYFWSLGANDPAPLSERVVNAGLFSFSVMLILGSHEMGHYLMARYHRVDSSLPYFIPIPLGFGTMGAVIRLRGQIPNRNALVDIGAAGPLAGMLIAIPLFAVGLKLCTIADVPAAPSLFPGQMSLWAVVPKLPKLYQLLFGAETAAGPVSQVFGDNLLTYAMQQWVVGPLPSGKDLNAHPVLLAAWFGMLVTMLNLMPIGQLDAGHLTFAWFGKHASTIGRVAAIGLMVMVVNCSWTWIFWFLVTTRLVGFGHPPVVMPDEPLTAGRKAVCAICFVLSALTLMPVPVGVSF
jgi:membrane-associated protease RseP (regulator of RpoE activity)